MKNSLRPVKIAALGVLLPSLIPGVTVLPSSIGRGEPPPTVSQVPDDLRARLKLSPFYQQWVDANGLPILGSDKASQAALLEAAWIINHMLDGRNDLRQALARSGVRVAVMAVNEFTCDIPEHADLEPALRWNLRARGLGATPERPAVSCGEENLLALRGDPYSDQNILIHEFGHAVHLMGMPGVDPAFDSRLRAAYEKAREAGLWEKTYAAINPKEYWATGVQAWFDCNGSSRFQNGIRTRDQLKAYDPPLASLLQEVFGDGPWRYVSPGERSNAGHLAGLDRERFPAFVWPPEWLRQKRDLARKTNGQPAQAKAPANGSQR